MTFCELLAESGEVSAWKKTEKFSCSADYEIVIARNGIAFCVIPTARTTWKKAYKNALEEHGGKKDELTRKI